MNKNKGFTILELVLYMGLLGIFLVIMTNLFVSTIEVRLESQTQSAIQQDGRFILQRLSYDIRRAQNIVLPLFGEQTNSLDLLINENQTNQHFIYSLDNQNLVLLINGERFVLNSRNSQITNLNFERIGNSDLDPQTKDGVQIKFTLITTSQKKSAPEVKNFQTTINLR